MNESQKRLYDVLVEMDEILERIDNNDENHNDTKKIMNSTNWINSNLDKDEFIDFMNEHCSDLLYEDTIKNLVNSIVNH